MNIFSTKYLLFSVLIVYSVFMVSCSCSNKENNTNVIIEKNAKNEYKPAYGDVLVEGTIADAQTLNPLLSTDDASGDVISLLFNGLVKYDKDLKIVGDLAQSWKETEKGFVFYLRKNVKWHDGEKFTADDVVNTYKLMINPSLPFHYKEYYKHVIEVRKIDDYTIEVIYDKKTANGLLAWGTEIVPKHILPNDDFKNGKDITKSVFNKKPIGTGPFKLKSWIEGDRIELEANKDYFEGRPYLDRYMFRVIPNKSVMFLSLKKGEIDMMYLKPDQYRKQSKNDGFKNTFKVYKYDDFSYSYMGFNLKNKILKNKIVRKAITMAINKQEIIDSVMFGQGKICTGPFPQISWAYNSEYKPPEYNVEKASKLLRDDGWKDKDNDGILEKDIDNDGNDEILKFELLTNNGNKSREFTSIIIQDQLSKIGIKVVPKYIEWRTLNEEFIDKGNFDAVILGWNLSKDPAFITNIWQTSNSPGGNNFIFYSNDKVDKLLEEGSLTFNVDKRKIIYHKIHKLIAEDYPYVFLYSKSSLVAVNNRFKNIKVAPAGIKYNIVKWYVPKVLQK